MKVIILCVALMSVSVQAAFNVTEFETAEQLQRYQALIAELRCLVCQNQNIADSNAELAVDLKNIVQQKILSGETDAQILDFMTERYGDFVLYRPPLKSKTFLLWLGPILFLFIALLLAMVYIRRTKKVQFNPSEEQRQNVRKLLDK